MKCIWLVLTQNGEKALLDKFLHSHNLAQFINYLVIW